MPISILYLAIMLIIMIVWFALAKRPVYEAILLSFLVLLTITGNWGNVWSYINEGLSTSLLYSMVAFVAMSVLLTKTKLIDGCVAVILAVLGRFSGGAGYAAVIASSFMGALSGSGPGNVMATGAITIPAMKRSGFPPELAANVESNASYLGNMIPPSSNILAALGAFAALYPETAVTSGQFWIILWGISIYFILQRLLMVWGFCKYYKIQPMCKDDIPSIGEIVRTNRKTFFIPFIILFPFVLDYLFKDTFFTERLGKEGAKQFSSSILLFIGGIASMYSCFICKDKEAVKLKKIAAMFSSSVKTIAPTIGVCIFGYMIGSLFSELNIAEDLGKIIMGWNFSKIGTVLAVCIITCFMGMVIPGSSLVVIFGPTFIAVLAGVGCSPLLVAAMLPCICGVMCGITPPLGLGLYAGMTLAESDFGKTLKNDLWWVAAQFILEFVILMGWLPIIGL